MSLFGFAFKPRRAASARVAKDRLQILLAQERRSGSTAPDYLGQLQNDIVEVIRKYVKIGEDGVDIRVDQGQEVSCLEINIELPSGGDTPARPSRS